MSFSFPGTSTSRLTRSTGNIATTGTMTICLWVKRTSNFSGIKLIIGVRPTGEGDAHELYCNDPSWTAYDMTLHANFASAQAVSDDPLALNTWTFVAIVGSGANISLKYWNGSALVTETVGQTSFVGNLLRVGDAGAGTHGFVGLMAHIRMWNAALNDTELNAERVSATVVRSSNLVSAHSGGGGDISTALTGESGTALTNAGAVTYSADTPTFSGFTGVVISGEANLPGESGGGGTGGDDTTRVNRLLYSGDLTNAVWSRQGNSISAAFTTPPFGTASRVLQNYDGGGVYQAMTNLPVGMSTASMLVKKGDTDYVCMRHVNGTFSAGAEGILNLLSGNWDWTNQFGGTSDAVYGSRGLTGGWWLIWIGATILGNRVLEFYPTASVQKIPAVTKYVDVAAFQYEDVNNGVVQSTWHKPTTSAVVTRTLSSVEVTFQIGTIGVGQMTNVFATFKDATGAPWDQYTPVQFVSGTPAVATVSANSGETNLNGVLIAAMTGVANGNTTVTASGGGVSDDAVFTVSGTPVSRYIDIRVESGWEGTTGWYVGVYAKHGSDRFPTTKHFEASNQSFESALVAGESQMLLPVPSGVSLSAGVVVEVVLENDNVLGRAVDGPGIFPATVV